MLNNLILNIRAKYIRLTLKHILLSAILFGYPFITFAENISVIYDKESPYQTDFFNKLSAHLSEVKIVRISTINSTELSPKLIKQQPIDTIINLDSNHIGDIIAFGLEVPTFHAMSTLASARRYAPCLPDCSYSLPQHLFFVLDQPAARQLELIRLISPTFHNIGVIVTQYSAPYLKQLNQLSSYKQLTITEHLSDSANVRFKIDNVSNTSDIILAIADTDIYNSSSLPQILLTSYRHRTPIIGFSKGFIKAGAIAGTVSNVQHLVRHLGEYLLTPVRSKHLQNGNLIHPKYFDVISNRSVAKSLNLYFPSDELLKKQLSAYEDIQ